MKKISKQEVNRFVKRWKDGGNEDGESHKYWYDILKTFCGITDIYYLDFEQHVKYTNAITGKQSTKRIDVYVPACKILIEQKSGTVDLSRKQSNRLTPYEQAKQYYDALPYSKRGRYIITCNFKELWIYDMDNPGSGPLKLTVEKVAERYDILQSIFIYDEAAVSEIEYKEETDASVKTSQYIGALYDVLISLYDDKKSKETAHSINVLIVRIVFLMFAEDCPGLLDHGIFSKLIKDTSPEYMNIVLQQLFEVLDTPVNKRRNISSTLKRFAYINGGLFREKILIPVFNDRAKEELGKCCSYNWANISPAIFGSVFESTLAGKRRHDAGMHYTPVEDIHKVIDPLFLDKLKRELNSIVTSSYTGAALERRYDAFQNKLASIKILDPACGSGNFLTETYISLRRLENRIFLFRAHTTEKGVQMQSGFIGSDGAQQIKVSINQMHGIEIDDFACVVARTALWIAEAQMFNESKKILVDEIDFFPLKSQAHIVEGNALKLDWHEVADNQEISYLVGNPPFLGAMHMDKIQKAEIKKVCSGVKRNGKIDYVSGWYIKACEYMLNTGIRAAFVSTNSITQGEHVLTLWRYLYTNFNIHINFAYRTFEWNSESINKAKVHCVIIGFSLSYNPKNKLLFMSDDTLRIVNNITPYLTDGDTVFLESRSEPICNVPKINFGSMPRDGGNFVLTPEERKEFIAKEPLSEKWIHPYVGAAEMLKGNERYCLWLVGANPDELKKCRLVMKRIQKVKEMRENSIAEGTKKFAKTPALFAQIAQPNIGYIMIPKTSSMRREYIPVAFADKDIIASDLVFTMAGGGLYEFAVISSKVHSAWVRLVAGRLKSDFRYSKDIVYNNFPWPSITNEQKHKIEQTAQGILDTRQAHENTTLGNLYDPDIMPNALRSAHAKNDREVLKAYGLNANADDSEIVQKLFKMYEMIIRQ